MRNRILGTSNVANRENPRPSMWLARPVDANASLKIEGPMNRLRPGPAWLLWLPFAVGAPATGSAQDFQTESPEAVAQEFYASFQSARWGAMAATLDDQALGLFRLRVLSVLRADATGNVAQQVFGMSPDAVRALEDEALFSGLIRGVFGYAAGMMQAMMTKRVKVMGHVLEADGDLRDEGDAATLAHVVLRSREPLSGTAPSTVSVLTLAQDSDGWRVRWSQELDVIASALVAVPNRGDPVP